MPWSWVMYAPLRSTTRTGFGSAHGRPSSSATTSGYVLPPPVMTISLGRRPGEARREAVGDLAGRRGHRPDRVLPLRQRLAADDPLVDGEPRQLERIGRLDRGRHGLRLVGRPDAGAPADHPDVDQDREPPPATRQPRGHPPDAQRPNRRGPAARAVAVEDAADPVEAGIVHHLVGDEDPLDPGLERDLGLPRVRDGDRPGAGLHLAAEDRRRHRGLAVRRERDAEPVAEGRQRGDVVGQRPLAQHERREPDRRVEQAAADPGVRRGRGRHVSPTPPRVAPPGRSGGGGERRLGRLLGRGDERQLGLVLEAGDG